MSATHRCRWSGQQTGCRCALRCWPSPYDAARLQTRKHRVYGGLATSAMTVLQLALIQGTAPTAAAALYLRASASCLDVLSELSPLRSPLPEASPELPAASVERSYLRGRPPPRVMCTQFQSADIQCLCVCWKQHSAQHCFPCNSLICTGCGPLRMYIAARQSFLPWVCRRLLSLRLLLLLLLLACLHATTFVVVMMFCPRTCCHC